MSTAKQAGGQGETEKGNQPVQKKRTRTTREGTQTQTALLTTDGFATALETVPGGLVQDEHDEKDLEETQRGRGQDVPACRCPDG
jgi:hypothetical protein